MNNRGGQVLKTGKIGRTNILRQQLLSPGETITPQIAGKVKLEGLRERDSLRIHAHLGVFLTPVRWLWPSFPDYLKEGPTSDKTWPTIQREGSSLGIGGNNINTTYLKVFVDAPIKIYNEWYKWPEQDDITAWPEDGPPAVPLAATWSRVRDQQNPDNPAEEVVDTSGGTFSVADLAQTQARFRQAMERDVLSFERYQEILKDSYGAKGSREVDQVPLMVTNEELSVDPRDVAATDGASLGQWMSLYDFDIRHQDDSITAPEHCVLTYVLTIRFASITEADANPLALRNRDKIWEVDMADPGILASLQPQEVQVRDVFEQPLATKLGYLPAGWEWRAGWNCVGKRIDDRNSFPLYTDAPQSATEARDATRINDAFRSQSLGDYVVDAYFNELSHSPMPNAMASYHLGVGNAGRGDDREFIMPRTLK